MLINLCDFHGDKDLQIIMLILGAIFPKLIGMAFSLIILVKYCCFSEQDNLFFKWLSVCTPSGFSVITLVLVEGLSWS
jgi:hypothetical protein